MKKKKRKRNKKKQKKKKVQEVSTTNTDPGKLADFHCEEEEERFFDTVIENFNKMVIDKKRIKCRVDEEWLQKIKQQIKPSWFLLFLKWGLFHSYQFIIFFPLYGDNNSDYLSHLPNFNLSSAETIPYAIAFKDKKNPL